MSGRRSNSRRTNILQAQICTHRRKRRRTAAAHLGNAPKRILVQGQREGVMKIGRNDPCPCGSGKKYKKCCGVRSGTRTICAR